MRENRSGYFRLTADPGEGKTAIMAEYVRRTGCVAHFNVLSDTYNKTAQFTQHVAAQLVARRLIADTGPPADSDLGVADLLIEARAALPASERLVLVVDALDEADRRDLPDTANVLLLPRILPTGVHVLVSSRRNQDVPLRVSTALIDMDLADYADASLDDVRDLSTRRSADGPLRAWISDRGITPVLVLGEEHVDLVAVGAFPWGVEDSGVAGRADRPDGPSSVDDPYPVAAAAGIAGSRCAGPAEPSTFRSASARACPATR